MTTFQEYDGIVCGYTCWMRLQRMKAQSALGIEFVGEPTIPQRACEIQELK